MDQARGPNRNLKSSSGGNIAGAPGQPAFHLSVPENPPVPVLVAVPHAGRTYPASLRTRLRHPAEASLRLEDRFIDLVGEAVARETGAAFLVALAPRAMIDLNRSPEDVDWEMVAEGAPGTASRMAAGRRARTGLGLVPRRLPGLGELWKSRLPAAELERRVEAIHRPYHAAITETLELLRDRWGAALLVDLHSMPPLGPKTGPSAAADFVVGDRFGASCGGNLSMLAMEQFERSGRRAAHNRPYAGGYVLDRHGAPARGIHAMQVEVCRAAYLERSLREPGAGMEGVVEVLTGLVRRAAAEISSSHSGMALAAE